MHIFIVEVNWQFDCYKFPLTKQPGLKLFNKTSILCLATDTTNEQTDQPTKQND